MEVLAEKVAVEKDGKRYICTLELVTVKGGQRVLYVAEDGTILKKEPFYRYNERISRRKTGSAGYAVKCNNG